MTAEGSEAEQIQKTHNEDEEYYDDGILGWLSNDTFWSAVNTFYLLLSILTIYEEGLTTNYYFYFMGKLVGSTFM